MVPEEVPKALATGSVVKNLPAILETTYNAGDAGLISGSGRSLKEGMATHSNILAGIIPWTEEPGRLQSTGSQKSDII